MSEMSGVTRTGGRAATEGNITGRHVLSVGRPKRSAPNGWHWHLLTDLARLETGHTPSRRRPEWWDGDIPWIGIKDATGNHGRMINDTLQHTNAEGIANSSARVLPAETVCLSRTASIGYVVVMGRPMATSQDFVNWVCGPDLNYQFLKYALLAERDSFSLFASGSVHQTIYFPEVKAFHLCAPDRPEQDAIVGVLASLDDKIELNRQTNETLEAMAQAVFRDWFVDFGPTRRKLAGVSDPIEIMGGLVQDGGRAAELAALFPDAIGDNGLPEGWEEQPLLDLCELKRGYDLPKKNREPGPVPIISSSGITGWHVTAMVEGPGIVTGRYGTIGHVFETQADFWPLNTTLYVRDFKEHPYWFVFYQLKGLSFKKFTDKAAVPGINRNDLHREPVTLPSDDAMLAFSKLATALMAKLNANAAENQTLAATRDLLLPKLMSGEIRLHDVEAMVEAAQ